MPRRRTDEWRYISIFFLISTLVVGEWSASPQGRFIPGEREHGTHWIGGWVDPKAGVNNVEKEK